MSVILDILQETTKPANPVSIDDDAALEKVIAFATQRHGEQKRKYTNVPHITHPLRVASLVKSTGAPGHVVAAAVLHDVLEDTPTTHAELVHHFGPDVADLVQELTDVYVAGSGGNRAQRKAKEAERLGKASPHAQTIKLADLIDNARDIEQNDPKFAKVYRVEKDQLAKVLTKGHPDLQAQLRSIGIGA
jgi:(p)ppGpp synthase/HD superfamily hydrolase